MPLFKKNSIEFITIRAFDLLDYVTESKFLIQRWVFNLFQNNGLGVELNEEKLGRPKNRT